MVRERDMPVSNYYPAASYPVGRPSAAPMESVDPHQHAKQYPQTAYAMPPSSYARPPYEGAAYPPATATTRAPNQLRTVVTTSFSVDEDREESNRAPVYVAHGPGQGHYGPPTSFPRTVTGEEDRHPRADARQGAIEEREEMRERAPPIDARPMRIAQSPQKRSVSFGHQEGGAKLMAPSSDSMKRSFWHHADPRSANSGMHPAFMPPKRTKKNPSSSKKDATLMPRVYGSERSKSWAASEERESALGLQHPMQQSLSFPAAWGEGGYVRGRLSEESSRSAFIGVPRQYAEARASFQHPVSRNGSFATADSYWGPYANTGIARSFSGAMASSSHSFNEERSHREVAEVANRVHMEHHRASDPFPPYRGSCDGYQRDQGVSTNIVTTHPAHHVPPSKSRRRKTNLPKFRHIEGPVQLLAQPEDQMSLSETLCTIRENVEVFIANEDDVTAPAPGRKHPVVVGQVGLRCIHCRNTVKSSDRVKRAVCYPSSIQRIYRTVIDMKLDHFLNCPFVPPALNHRLNELKQVSTRSTGTTMQYFVRSAQKMGMVDGPSGIRVADQPAVPLSPAASRPAEEITISAKAVVSQTSDIEKKVIATEEPVEQREAVSSAPGDDGSRDAVSSVASHETPSFADASSLICAPIEPVYMAEFSGEVLLSVKEDKSSLSPLRCFLRENVCAFSAVETDIAVRTPTTFSVAVGQVGIGCVHCRSLPAKERFNRSVCFPFSISRIYQSVADIQRFHFAECKHVPPEIRQKFFELQSQSTKGSKGLATRQYWVSSAKKIGLVDTPQGIRFCRDPAVAPPTAVSLDILAQVASNVNPTTTQNIVTPEDEPQIAQFLYLVMEQLKICRFTEADRNKRRLKDVGCLGVECKHCAGTVEGRKFFWSSVNAVESNFVSVHTHMMECKMVPESLKERLAELKKLRKAQTSSLVVGSQKAFFARVWHRLHRNDAESPAAAVALCQPAIKTEAASAPSAIFGPGFNKDVAMVSI